MNLLETIHELPRTEKIKVMEFLWDDITVEEKSYSSPKWHKTALRETEKRVSEGKEILTAAYNDLKHGRIFYELQAENLGGLFF